ncbi:twin-arginine translocation pathway signal protein [Aliihoeflea aestuarii]|jgi:TRAP-type C4-dicarboxylate transport system substrate-binding protein|uniref:TRAP transporter substrate-binding protein DctP n=1 Tax=Aliihoeflea aestuarii TaxID=453840 RepID=UPI0020923434|nr:TRAP transporter substrate-binding protein DctP [Aliihoeflea aestuarii]MCO6389628.1 twin-arginine translocation pathway signal protein [Aliihoeflea aestuarii]
MSFISRLALVPAAIAAFAFMPMAANAQDTVTWRVQSHWPQSSSSYSDSLEHLRDVLDERTGGRLKLELHAAGGLFGHDEIFNATRRGIIQMGTISPAYIMGEVPTAGIANGLPNAFQNTWEAAYFFKHLGFEDMVREEAAQHGIFYSTDKVYPTEMVLVRKPESMDDFRSLNIRSSGTLQTFLTAAGAASNSIAGAELYQALTSGIVDGAHWGAVQGALSMSLYEVAKYHVRPPLNIGGIDAFVVNQEAIDALPEDVQQIFYNAMEEQFWRRTNEYIYQEQVALARAQAEHNVEVIELPEDVRTQMLQAAQQTWEQERARGGKAAEAMEMLEAFLTELGHL